MQERQRLAEQKVKERRRQEREERRRLRKKQQQHNSDEEELFAKKIAMEERKLLEAQRKLESIRLLDELFERVKVNPPNHPPVPPYSQALPTAAAIVADKMLQQKRQCMRG